MRVISALVLALCVLASRAKEGEAPGCPDACSCSSTAEGLHRAVCSSPAALKKYSLRNKHHNLNILVLSHAKITKLQGDLDRFTEIVSVDLSFNRITHLDKLMRDSKKLVHLNLRRNLMRVFSATVVPASVSSLDLQDNLLSDVPADLGLLPDLEHLLLRGNPLACTCDNLRALDSLRRRGAVVDDVKCSSPPGRTGRPWDRIKIADACILDKKPSRNILLEDMMLGDQPIILGSAEDKQKSELDIGDTFEVSGSGSGDVHPGHADDDDDEKVFIGVSENHKGKPTTPEPDISILNDEGSGDGLDFFSSSPASYTEENIGITTEDPVGFEGSGSGVEIIGRSFPENESSTPPVYYDYDAGSGDDIDNVSTTTTEAFITGNFNSYFDNSLDRSTSTNEPFIMPDSPNIFQGKVNWDDNDPHEETTKRTEVQEETIKRKESDDVGVVPVVKQAEPGVSHEELQEEEATRPTKSSVGTYICIGILIAILVGLIAITLIKSQVRRRRDKRLMRQQKKDVEKAGKEMVDMNKSLLGKPVVVPNEAEKKLNGNYELVPTHDPSKVNGNKNLDNRKSVNEPLQKSDDPNRNLQSAVDAPRIEVSEVKNAPNDEKPTVNLVPLKSAVDTPLTNGNGQHYDHLPPPQEYTPVYTPESGRVRIKLSEIPKPKTPVLVTRSRSNAGEIIITPALEQSPSRKSAT